ncbi:18S rRNA (guanine-N(7))-methyltransferase [Lepeophtheirus salmonis]|uniref:18S rRNA (guanine-N(7))-methyltransferase n=1 Tax=Lepeophtheirus salmonis TaxID=72036 RepID=C1BVM1_LEPSM|nr:probable 18S rRNA (guanine-N(7))-methyltransferase [Lepeophtheirus salmonis]ACO13074.1 methyltransferase WBSCR22 [Lepeophtheirus salmonis]
MSSVRRPEHKAPPDVFYNEDEAQKYTTNTRMMQIQNDMTERAMELLNLPPDVPCFILDLGCGSGLSGEVLEENGHFWIGMDISSAMLNVAREREVEGDLILSDMGDGIPFRAGSFDGAISISALQWLCNADKSYHHPQKRLYTFFSSLYSSLSCGARAIFQFYPENNQQIEMITNASMRAGFTGGIVVDYPNSTKAKKFFLVLMTGGNSFLPKALGEEDEESQTVKHEKKRERMKRLRNGKSVKKSRDWILEKKERRRRQGRDTRPDTKFTGRKRSGRL